MATVRDRGNGSYQMVFTFGKNPNGKPKQYTNTYRHPSGESSNESKFDALEIAKQWEQSVKTGNRFNPTRTVQQLIQIYLANGIKGLKENTVSTYKSQFSKRIIPVFGKYIATELSTSQINEYLELLQNELKAGSRHKLVTALSSVYTFGVQRGYLKENPCRFIINPPDEENDEQWTMSIEQAQRYIAFIKSSTLDEDLKRIILILCLTGLRISECLALSWSDIDLINQTLTVRHTLTAINGLHLTKPKTKKSRRSIAFGTECPGQAIL